MSRKLLVCALWLAPQVVSPAAEPPVDLSPGSENRRISKVWGGGTFFRKAGKVSVSAEDPFAGDGPIADGPIKMDKYPRIDRVIHALGPEAPYDVRSRLAEFGLIFKPDEVVLYSAETGLLFCSGEEENVKSVDILLSEIFYTPPAPNVEVTLRVRHVEPGGGDNGEALCRVLTCRGGRTASFERREKNSLLEKFEVNAVNWQAEEIDMFHDVKLEGGRHVFNASVPCGDGEKGKETPVYTCALTGGGHLEWSVNARVVNLDLTREQYGRAIIQRWPDAYARKVAGRWLEDAARTTNEPPVAGLYPVNFIREFLHAYDSRSPVWTRRLTLPSSGIPGEVTAKDITAALKGGRAPVAEGDRVVLLEEWELLYVRSGPELRDHLDLQEELRNGGEPDQTRIVLEKAEIPRSGAAPSSPEVLRAAMITGGLEMKSEFFPDNGAEPQTLEMAFTFEPYLANGNLSLRNFPAGKETWTVTSSPGCFADGAAPVTLAGGSYQDKDGNLRGQRWTLRAEPVFSLAEKLVRDPEKRAALLREIEAALEESVQKK